MTKRTGLLLFLCVIFIALNGCATAHKKDMNQGLKDQVQALETQVQEKDQEIAALRDALSKARGAGMGEAAGMSNTTARRTMKNIQLALQNAGYNPGPIDGRKGKQTVEAIKAFQKANGLSADGKVGKKTWELLGKYLAARMK